MKKLMKSISVCAICLIVLLVAFSACSGNSDGSLDYQIIEFHHIGAGIMKMISDVPQRVDTFEGLTAFFDDAEMPINDKDNINYDTDIYRKFRSYDKKYFKDNSLIIVFISKPHLQNLEVANLKIKDDTFILNVINDYDPYDSSVEYPAVADDHLTLIEINKHCIANVKTIVTSAYNHLNFK